MAILRLAGPGVWWGRSEKDPRWNCSGVTERLGGYLGPSELSKKLKELDQQLGEQPDDFRWNSLPVDFIAEVIKKVGNDPEILQKIVGLSDEEVRAINLLINRDNLI